MSVRREGSSAGPHEEGTVWAPRAELDRRLRELEALLARPSSKDTIPVEVERASLLAATGRREEAKLAFIGILRKAPTDFAALNEFGALLTDMGATEAACRIYTEAISHHPNKPAGHINLANLLWRANKYDDARKHYEAALRIDPDYAQAHQGLGAVLADIGERAAAREHFRKGFRGHAISTLPYRGVEQPIRVLQLISSGGGNIPTAPFLDDTRFQTIVAVADHLDMSDVLPPHDLIFNAIGDADLCDEALQVASRIAAQAAVPVLNDPRAVMKTSRIENAVRLSEIDGVRTARTIAVVRKILAGPDGAAHLDKLGFSFPLLLRSSGYHTGRNFVCVETPAALRAAAAELPGDDLLVIEYLDARGADGKSRKYRVMMIDGELYPLHLAISRNWKVHYFTSDMAIEADHRAKEAKFLADMPGVLGAKAMAALSGIRDALGLDYAGVDFALDSESDLLLFEANATMILAKPGDDARWTYRRDAIDCALKAAMALVEARAISANANQTSAFNNGDESSEH